MIWIIDAKKANGTSEISIKFNNGKNAIVDLKSIYLCRMNIKIKNT